jgi:hypothetical protein
MAPSGSQRRMKMEPRWRSVYAAASATEVELLWRSQSPPTSMAGTRLSLSPPEGDLRRSDAMPNSLNVRGTSSFSDRAQSRSWGV